MQNLTGTVGEGGANARHDAALVQAILVRTQRPRDLDPREAAYLDRIDGECGDRTNRALRQFQYDRVFVDASSRVSHSVDGAVAGRVAPGDVTWKKMLAAVPRESADLRVLAGGTAVYVAATSERRDAAVARVGGLTFQPRFRASVTAVINRVFEKHGIAISVCADGDRRTFDTQYGLLVSGRNVTHNGPGESNHNFGQAVDLGFDGLCWLRPDGAIAEDEDSLLHQLDPAQTATGQALLFWNVIRSSGQELGLFRGPEADRPHLQAWNDSTIDMAARLAAHLTRSGTMRWSARHHGAHQPATYQCDLGLGGRLFDVGTAAQIWSRQATVTIAMLTDARTQGAPAAAGSTGPRAPGVRVHASRAPAPVVTALDVTATRGALRAEFEAADRNWQSWTAQ